MKINIEIDLTPDEFRTLMGWPDVQGLQNDLIAQFREQVAAIVERDALVTESGHTSPRVEGQFAQVGARGVEHRDVV